MGSTRPTLSLDLRLCAAPQKMISNWKYFEAVKIWNRRKKPFHLKLINSQFPLFSDSVFQTVGVGVLSADIVIRTLCLGYPPIHTHCCEILTWTFWPLHLPPVMNPKSHTKSSALYFKLLSAKNNFHIYKPHPWCERFIKIKLRRLGLPILSGLPRCS